MEWEWFFPKIVLELMEKLIFFMTIPVVGDQSNHNEVHDVCIPGGVTRDGKEMLVGEFVTDLSSSRDVETR